MPTFISFDEFTELIGHSSGILLFVLTATCDGEARRLGRRLQRTVGASAAVHLMCTGVASPTLVFYVGGHPQPLVKREGPAPSRAVLADLAEAMRLSSALPSVHEDLKRQADADEKTEHMLATEKLDQFPPFFRMARNLARDAWYVARRSAEGAPVLLSSEAAAARLLV